ncbi:hypothetical protein Pst134EA_031304 [Puccinia striiformis f. sp. tritici]|uniref:uncharacterized protein n=1 Tax=Puccinia striiformis f. sp. tritici TaxID=168172 RepID=UPI0020085DAC|nr:uncharacterized protein Pst134EA_031304 [Puccinia striiformis f. sp. tritici]KAH9445384.1 hypothetical protein Pst134EA_031304 [Puccinia striiformis f. sp. tritici]
MAHQVPFRQPAITVPLKLVITLLELNNNHNHHLHHHLYHNRYSNKKLELGNDLLLMKSRIHDHQILKPCSALPKRTKRSINTNHPLIEPEHQIDLGTALVSLTKNELIGILQGLIQQKPEPKTNQKNIFGIGVRVPLNTYVNDCLSSLEISNKSIENRCASKPTSDGGIKSPELSVIYGGSFGSIKFIKLSKSFDFKDRIFTLNLSTHQPLLLLSPSKYKTKP